MRAETLEVSVVLSEEGGVYAEFGSELQKVLSGKATVRVVSVTAGPLPHSGLAIGVGMKAAEAVAAGDVPHVLNVLVPRAGHEKLLRDFPRRGAGTLSAIFLDQPAYRQAGLIAAALPRRRNVGLLYSALPDGVAELRQELAARGLVLHEQAVAGEDRLADALREVLQRSDVLLALPDAQVYNGSTIRNILLASYRSSVPLVGFSPGYVRAGALCAIFSTPAQVAAQAAKMVSALRETHALPEAGYPEEFEVLVNEQVARSLDLPLASAAALHDRIQNRRMP